MKKKSLKECEDPLVVGDVEEVHLDSEWTIGPHGECEEVLLADKGDHIITKSARITLRVSGKRKIRQAKTKNTRCWYLIVNT